MPAKATYNDAAVDDMLRGPGGEVAQDINRRGRAVLGQLQRSSPVASGQLRTSWTMEPDTTRGSPAARITSDAPQAIFVDSGTGIYGRGMPIRPVTKRVLSWTGASGRTFARQTRGTPRHPFIAASVDAAL